MSIKIENSNKFEGAIPLSELSIDEEGKVSHIASGRGATNRLSGMGITVGTTIKVLSKAPFQGPIQISVRGTRLALGRGLTKKILIIK